MCKLTHASRPRLGAKYAADQAAVDDQPPRTQRHQLLRISSGVDGQWHRWSMAPTASKDRGQQLAVKRTHLQNTRCSSHVHAVTHTKNTYEEQPITASFFTSLTSRTWVFPHCSSVNSEECRANQKFISYSSHQEHICSSCSTGFVLRMSRGKHLLGHMENNQRTSCSTSVEPQEQMKNMCSLFHFAKSCSS